MTPSEKNPVWGPNNSPIERLARIEERQAAHTEQQKEHTKQLKSVENKLDHFIEKHNDSCPGRFNLLGVVALLAGLIAIVKSFVFTGKAP